MVDKPNPNPNPEPYFHGYEKVKTFEIAHVTRRKYGRNLVKSKSSKSNLPSREKCKHGNP